MCNQNKKYDIISDDIIRNFNVVILQLFSKKVASGCWFLAESAKTDQKTCLEGKKVVLFLYMCLKKMNWITS